MSIQIETMAQDTTDNQFRKIDVDQYGDDVFKEDSALDATTPGSPILSEKDVTNLLNSGKHKEALKLALNSAPLRSKDHRKDHHKLMMKIMHSIKSSEIESFVNELNLDEIDILMKYVYRGFESPPDNNSNTLLIWHDKAFNKGGVGSIVRVLTDKFIV